MGRVAEQIIALVQGFLHQPELTVFKVANAAMQHVGRGHAGPGAEIPFIYDQTIYALQGQIPESANAIDPGADDEYGRAGIFFDALYNFLSVHHELVSPGWNSTF